MKNNSFQSKGSTYQNQGQYHESVMVNEVVDALHIKRFAKGSCKVIDATLGTGGHSLALMEAGCEVLGIEADPKMLAIAKKRVPNGNFVLGNFVNIDIISGEKKFDQVDGVLLDLGVSNLHLKSDGRGFSFSDPSQILDMRLNPDLQGVRAADLLNALDKTQLTDLFSKVMKYPDAKRLAAEVVKNRPINTVDDLSKVVEVTSLLAKRKSVNQMTLPMLALRIAVNSELENLEIVLKKAYDLLKKGGKLLVLTFHSTEDRIVEGFSKNQKVVMPTEAEVFRNPRSRSVRLRVITKE